MDLCDPDAPEFEPARSLHRLRSSAVRRFPAGPPVPGPGRGLLQPGARLGRETLLLSEVVIMSLQDAVFFNLVFGAGLLLFVKFTSVGRTWARTLAVLLLIGLAANYMA